MGDIPPPSLPAPLIEEEEENVLGKLLVVFERDLAPMALPVCGPPLAFEPAPCAPGAPLARFLHYRHHHGGRGRAGDKVGETGETRNG
jgi:hypothetical protein